MKRVLQCVGLVLCLAVPALSGTAPTLSSTMTSKIQLTYFNIEGVAEKVLFFFITCTYSYIHICTSTYIHIHSFLEFLCLFVS